jgi:hypothetical protein
MGDKIYYFNISLILELVISRALGFDFLRFSKIACFREAKIKTHRKVWAEENKGLVGEI